MIRLCRCGEPIRGQYGDRCEDCWIGAQPDVQHWGAVVQAARLIGAVEHAVVGTSPEVEAAHIIQTPRGLSIVTVTDRGATMT